MKLWHTLALMLVALFVAWQLYGQGFSRDVTVTGDAPTTYEDGAVLDEPVDVAIYHSENGEPFTRVGLLQGVQPGAQFAFVHQGRGKGIHRYQAAAITADGIESERSETAQRAFRATSPPTNLQVN